MDRLGIAPEQVAFVKVDVQGSEVPVLPRRHGASWLTGTWPGRSRSTFRRCLVAVSWRTICPAAAAPIISPFHRLEPARGGGPCGRSPSLTEALAYLQGGAEGRTDILLFSFSLSAQTPVRHDFTSPSAPATRAVWRGARVSRRTPLIDAQGLCRRRVPSQLQQHQVGDARRARASRPDAAARRRRIGAARSLRVGGGRDRGRWLRSERQGDDDRRGRDAGDDGQVHRAGLLELPTLLELFKPNVGSASATASRR